MSTKLTDGTIKVRGLEQGDLPEADRIMRLAFGTFLGLPNPMEFMGDADYVRTRWAADPSSALAAEVDGALVGTNFVTRWGSVGFFGPLTVLPSLWDRGVARRLMGATMDIFKDWGVSHQGLFTFGHSPKHLSLYQSYGFLPGFLTPVTAKAVSGETEGWSGFSQVGDHEQTLRDASELTGAVCGGLDLRREIEAAYTQKLGDTVLVHDGGELAALAVCHVGPGTEAGSGACYVKFGAARPGDGAPQRFGRLLEACEGFAATRGASTVVAGVNTSRRGAYRGLLERGYRLTELVGVTMHQPDPGPYHDAQAYVIDDWR